MRIIKIRYHKLIAPSASGGLTATILLAFLFLAVLYIPSARDGIENYYAWRMGGEFLGKEGVVLQDKSNNCGPAALKMIFDHFEIPAKLTEIEQHVDLTHRGSSMLALKEMAELKGLKAEGWRFTLEDFLKVPMPAIVFVHDDHFAVVDSVSKDHQVYVRDPARGRFRLAANKLPRIWEGETLVFQK